MASLRSLFLKLNLNLLKSDSETKKPPGWEARYKHQNWKSGHQTRECERDIHGVLLTKTLYITFFSTGTVYSENRHAITRNVGLEMKNIPVKGNYALGRSVFRSAENLPLSPFSKGEARLSLCTSSLKEWGDVPILC